MSELNGCPICGGEMHFEDFDQMPCPVCEKCGCVFSFYKEDYSEEEVAKIFNSRPLEDALRARIGELEGALKKIGENPIYDENCDEWYNRDDVDFIIKEALKGAGK